MIKRLLHGLATLGGLRCVLAVILVGGNALHAATPFQPTPIGLPDLKDSFIAAGDYDGDGWMDVALSGVNPQTEEDVCQVWKNTGGSFTLVSDALPRTRLGSLYWIDMDHDGRLDLVVSGIQGATTFTSEVWRNEGSTFAKLSRTTFKSRNGDISPVGRGQLADLNNDGRPDLFAVGRYGGFEFSYLFTNTGSAFVHAQITNSIISYGGAAVLDLEGDGFVDGIVSGIAKDDTGDIHASYILRNQENLFSTHSNDLLPLWDSAVGVFDQDRDGREDVILLGSPVLPFDEVPAAHLWINTGTGFRPETSNFPGYMGGLLAMADFDDDGWMDVLVTGRTQGNRADRVVELFRSTDIGNFEPVLSTGIGGTEGGISWIDVDNDGRLDLIHTGGNPDGQQNLGTTLWRNTFTTVNSRPGSPANLGSVVQNGFLRISWDAASDAETPSPALSYNVRVGSTPGGVDVVDPLAGPTGVRRVMAAGNSGPRRFMLLKTDLSRPLYWSVQAVDGGLLGGPFAPERSHFEPVVVIPIITSAAVNPALRFELKFDADGAGSYDVEYADSFTEEIPPLSWRRLGPAVSLGGGKFSFTDPSRITGYRLYRIVAR